LIDRLETNTEFLRLLKDHELLTDEAFTKMKQLSSTLEDREKKYLSQEASALPQTPAVTKVAPSTITLRILCIQKDIVKEMIPFMALDENGRFFVGNIDRSLVKDEMSSDTMIRCVVNLLIDDEEYGQEIKVTINDSIEIIADDPSFPKLSQLETRVEDIDLQKSPYVLRATI
jgi:hypothetical protein